MLSIYDYLVVICYFAFMITIGIVTKKFINNTCDYFRGGGKMLWWMAGASAFMVQFSAWTFTGAAGEAYLNGPIVLMIFFGNALGFLANYLYFAPKFRQMRVVTAMQGIKQRFGRSGEQFFTWLQVPLGTLNAGVWLMGLSIFISTVFQVPLEMTIICVGLVVVFNSTIGGSWAVVSSDFIQVLVLMMIAIVTVVYSFIEIGGPMEMVNQFPLDSVLGENFEYSAVIYIWAIVMMINQFFKTNHMLDASRYLNAKDSNNARKAALLSCCLFIVGPILWFIPPIIARIVYPDLSLMFPGLNNPAEASYVAIALKVLPQGMMGLLLAGMFGATISSMDSGLNKNAGIFVKNVYLNLIKPKASEVEQMFIAKITTFVLGIAIILTALFYSTLKNVGLFDLMITIGALVGIPSAVPLVLGLVIKKTPSWSGWSTVVVGFCCSICIKYHFDALWLAQVFNLDFMHRDVRYTNQSLAVVINILIPSIWFIFTTRFYREPAGERKAELALFWKNQATPVISIDNEETRKSDESQGKLVGGLAGIYGIFICLLSLIPNSIDGRFVFLACGMCLLTLGVFIYRSTKIVKDKTDKVEDVSYLTFNKKIPCTDPN